MDKVGVNKEVNGCLLRKCEDLMTFARTLIPNDDPSDDRMKSIALGVFEGLTHFHPFPAKPILEAVHILDDPRGLMQITIQQAKEKRIRFLEMGAAEKDTECMYILARSCIAGNGIPRNLERSEEILLEIWNKKQLEDAALRLEAGIDLADLWVFSHLGCAEKIEKAVEIYEDLRTRKQNFTEVLATVRLANIYRFGRNSIPKDLQKAKTVLEVGVDMENNGEILFNLAFMIEFGEVEEISLTNLKLALLYYKEAAEDGYLNAKAKIRIVQQKIESFSKPISI